MKIPFTNIYILTHKQLHRRLVIMARAARLNLYRELGITPKPGIIDLAEKMRRKKLEKKVSGI